VNPCVPLSIQFCTPTIGLRVLWQVIQPAPATKEGTYRSNVFLSPDKGV